MKHIANHAETRCEYQICIQLLLISSDDDDDDDAYDDDDDDDDADDDDDNDVVDIYAATRANH